MKIFKIIIICLLLSSLAKAEELNPLASYLKENSFDDPRTKLYFYDRCSGLILNLLHRHDHGYKLPSKFMPLMKDGYVQLTKLTIDTIQNDFENHEAVSNQEMIQMDKQYKLYNSYISKIMKNMASINEDNLINSDVNFCYGILKK